MPSSLRPALLLAWLTGCAPETEAIDADGDGYEALVDCDDAAAEIHPGAAERCNELDDDCDWLVDDEDDEVADPSTWYADEDGDGVGAGLSREACAALSGEVATTGDCDDTNAAVYPGAPELCDGIIDDCAAATLPAEEEDLDGDSYVPCTVDPETWQGFGHPYSGDCDDADPGVHPDAREICDVDETDEDCDGLVNAADPDVDADGLFTWYPDADADGFGYDAGALQDCYVPDGYVAVGGDCDDADPSAAPDLEEVCGDGIDNDCDADPTDCQIADATIDTADLVWSFGADSYAMSVALSDIDGDGHTDVFFGTKVDQGEVFLQYGPISAGGTMPASDTVAFVGEGNISWAGNAISASGDIDGDGLPELAVGAYQSKTTNTAAGEVFLISGGARWSGTNALEDAATWRIQGSDSRGYLGSAVRFVGDVDQDGEEELAIGGYGLDYKGDPNGGVYLVSLAELNPGTQTVGDVASLAVFGVDYAEDVGDFNTISDQVDLDGDGGADLAFGSGDGTNGPGILWIFLGARGLGGSMTVNDADATVEGEDSNTKFACSVQRGGDLDGDGYDDLLVGASSAMSTSGTRIGAVDLIPGSATGWTIGRLTTSISQARIQGDATSDSLGSIEDAGDTNSDGFPDLLLGSRYYDSDSTSNIGGVWLFYGPVSGEHTLSEADARFVGTDRSDYLGWDLRVGDLNGDGDADLLMADFHTGSFLGMWGVHD